jgi:soluble lytic murein transglycosylase
VILGFGFRGTSLAVGVALTCAGLATAQGLTGDSPMAGVGGPVGYDTPAVGASLSAAKSGDAARLRAILNQTTDPLAREVALWAMADAAPEALTWDEANAARRDLADWPRPSRRQVAAERLLERSGLSPAEVVAWFGAGDPLTPQGAMALADAQRATGHPDEAAATIRRAWRTLTFDQLTQDTMLARFAGLLTQADHEAREDFLLYGSQGPAAQDLLRLLPPDRQALAEARMAVRRGDPSAASIIAALPSPDQMSPGLVYERVISLRDHGNVGGALVLIPYLPATLPDENAAKRLWKHGALVVGALQAGDANTAYQVAARSGLTSGTDATEAQFYAGWIALSRFKDPKLADNHFERLGQIGGSPITQSRALYWRGRAAEAQNDLVTAQIFYEQASKFYTTFYGQLAAAKGGRADIVLGHDPTITPGDRAAFETRDCVRAIRLLAGMDNKEAVHTFVVGLSESLPTLVDEAMLVDLARGYGEQELSMRVVRNAARRGFILPERGYPIRSAPIGPDFAEAPLVLGVTRQESSFDPLARSGAGARGMMQLMPTTAQNIARRSGFGWGSLDDPDFNMRVGSLYLDQLVNQFSGSYVMAAAAYNAGPSRPAQWAGLCGDPRGSTTDPLDFIECIPFSETRDYVMRVMEATQVYRARLNGGSAPITLALDLKRGAYGYQPLGLVQPASTPPIVLGPPSPGGR